MSLRGAMAPPQSSPFSLSFLCMHIQLLLVDVVVVVVVVALFYSYFFPPIPTVRPRRPVVLVCCPRTRIPQ